MDPAVSLFLGTLVGSLLVLAYQAWEDRRP
jgi:hypothetical protein